MPPTKEDPQVDNKNKKHLIGIDESTAYQYPKHNNWTADQPINPEDNIDLFLWEGAD